MADQEKRVSSAQQAMTSQLTAAGVTYEKIRQLHGGMSNFIWRLDGLRLPSPTGAAVDGHLDTGERANSAGQMHLATACVKYAEAQCSLAPMTGPVDRLQTEARIFHHAGIRNSSPADMKVPQLLAQTPQAVVMAWAGEHTLRQMYEDAAAGTHDFHDMGVRAGRWLARLHALDAPPFPANEFRAMTLGSHASSAQEALKERGHGQAVLDGFLQLRTSESGPRRLCHGDFRPANILVSPRAAAQDGASSAGVELTICDWEVSAVERRSYVMDLAFWIADAYSLECTTRREEGLLRGFLQAYHDASGASALTLDVVCRVAAEVAGFYLRFVPLVRELWHMDEQVVRHLLDEAGALAVQAVHRDAAALRESRLVGGLMG